MRGPRLASAIAEAVHHCRVVLVISTGAVKDMMDAAEQQLEITRPPIRDGGWHLAMSCNGEVL